MNCELCGIKIEDDNCWKQLDLATNQWLFWHQDCFALKQKRELKSKENLNV